MNTSQHASVVARMRLKFAVIGGVIALAGLAAASPASAGYQIFCDYSTGPGQAGAAQNAPSCGTGSSFHGLTGVSANVDGFSRGLVCAKARASVDFIPDTQEYCASDTVHVGPYDPTVSRRGLDRNASFSYLNMHGTSFF